MIFTYSKHITILLIFITYTLFDIRFALISYSQFWPFGDRKEFLLLLFVYNQTGAIRRLFICKFAHSHIRLLLNKQISSQYVSFYLSIQYSRCNIARCIYNKKQIHHKIGCPRSGSNLKTRKLYILTSITAEISL